MLFVLSGIAVHQISYKTVTPQFCKCLSSQILGCIFHWCYTWRECTYMTKGFKVYRSIIQWHQDVWT